MSAKEQVRVLICDDSALIRQLLSTMLEGEPDICVVGTAENPVVARQMIKQLNPDVLTLDIEMPGMDGLSFLEKIMTLRPMPVVLISSLTQRGTQHTIRGLELGAFDVIGKPTKDLRNNFGKLKEEVTRKVRAASKTKQKSHHQTGGRARAKLEAGFGSPRLKLIGLGASTGGVVALKEVITRLPQGCPPVVVTQHMPASYTVGFANRLNQSSAVTVKEAENRETLLPSHVYVAPGDFHLQVRKSARDDTIFAKLDKGPRVSGHRPSVDVLFGSIAETGIKPVAAAILTGMGADGAEGMLAMRKAGAATIGQDEATSTIYGMPRAAYELGAVIWQSPLDEIADRLVKLCWPRSQQRQEAACG